MVRMHKIDAVINPILLPKQNSIPTRGYSLQDPKSKLNLTNCDINDVRYDEIICGDTKNHLEWNLGEPLLMACDNCNITLIGIFSMFYEKSSVFINVSYYLKWIDDEIQGK